MSKPEGFSVPVWFWTRDETDDPYKGGDIRMDYDPECSIDWMGVAFHVGATSFTIPLETLLHNIAAVIETDDRRDSK